MAEKTSTESKPVTIDNPEMASTNFYWTYETEKQVFNLQTTIRGTLTFEQIQAHIASALAATAHVCMLGGNAKQVGRSSDVPSSPLPVTATPPMTPPIPEEPPLPSEPVYEPIPQAPQTPKAPEEFSFTTVKLYCTLTDGKMYFKVAGGQYVKYGVTVWPEVLDGVGIKWGELQAKPYDFPGYKAVYVKNAKGSPQKVIRLEKIA